MSDLIERLETCAARMQNNAKKAPIGSQQRADFGSASALLREATQALGEPVQPPEDPEPEERCFTDAWLANFAREMDLQAISEIEDGHRETALGFFNAAADLRNELE